MKSKEEIIDFRNKIRNARREVKELLEEINEMEFSIDEFPNAGNARDALDAAETSLIVADNCLGNVSVGRHKREDPDEG